MLNVKKIALAAIVATTMGGITSTAHAACSNDVWNKVMSRGKVVVGVKADYKPWGFRNTDGDIVGMEIDIAQAAADAMGVELETVAVQSSNRMQFLEQGKIDMMIATMSDRADRREIVGITQPNYYTSGTNIMSPKALGFAIDDFEMPLSSEDDNPWALAVPLAEKDCVFGHFMSGLTFNMHQSGKLVELESKWGIKPTAYLENKQAAYSDWLSDK